MPERSPLHGAEGCGLRGETGFASQAWILCKVGEPSEDLWHPERGQGDSLAQDIRDKQLKPCSLSKRMHLTPQWCLTNVSFIHRESIRKLEYNHYDWVLLGQNTMTRFKLEKDLK